MCLKRERERERDGGRKLYVLCAFITLQRVKWWVFPSVVHKNFFAIYLCVQDYTVLCLFWVTHAAAVRPGKPRTTWTALSSGTLMEELELSLSSLPRTHAQGVKQSVCTSVVVVVVGTKIATLGDLGIWATRKHDELVKIGEKPASVCLDFFSMAHECHK